MLADPAQVHSDTGESELRNHMPSPCIYWNGFLLTTSLGLVRLLHLRLCRQRDCLLGNMLSSCAFQLGSSSISISSLRAKEVRQFEIDNHWLYSPL